MRLAIGLLAVVAFAQDAATTLEQARAKVLAATAHLPNYVCVETIDRSYYSRQGAAESCERLLLDRKRGQEHLHLDKTDRLRVAVSVVNGHEIYSWTGSEPYTHGVEDILNGGPIGTGPFAVHVLQVFTAPEVRFRLLGEPSDAIDYGFRVPVEAAPYLVMGSGKWLATGYSGSLRIDAGSLELRRIELATDELPPETGMCEERTALEYRGSEALPSEARTRLIMRDASQSERVTTISGCHEASTTPLAAPGRRTAPVPKDMRFILRFDADIDAATAAAGDEISATVTLPVSAFGMVVDAGSKVTGRIVQMTHEETRFVISIAFDTLIDNGVASPFCARLISPPPLIDIPSTGTRLTGHGIKDWPHGTFAFGARPGVIPAGFKTTWLTVAPEELK